MLSATIITREASVADALATACLIDGERLASRYCASHADTMAILVLDDEARSIKVFGASAAVTLSEGVTE